MRELTVEESQRDREWSKFDSEIYFNLEKLFLLLNFVFPLALARQSFRLKALHSHQINILHVLRLVVSFQTYSRAHCSSSYFHLWISHFSSFRFCVLLFILRVLMAEKQRESIDWFLVTWSLHNEFISVMVKICYGGFLVRKERKKKVGKNGSRRVSHTHLIHVRMSWDIFYGFFNSSSSLALLLMHSVDPSRNSIPLSFFSNINHSLKQLMSTSNIRENNRQSSLALSPYVSNHALNIERTRIE